MKKSLLVIFVFLSNCIFAQSPLKLESQFRFEIIKPIAFGNNALSKSNSNLAGAGFNWSPLVYNNFRIGIGVSSIAFKVTDRSKVGNFGRTNYNSLYGFLSYDYSFNKKITFIPYLAIGTVTLRQKGEGRNSTQDGTEYKLGICTDYEIGESTAIYAKLNYAFAKLNIQTASEYEKYFGQTQQIQFAIGIKF